MADKKKTVQENVKAKDKATAEQDAEIKQPIEERQEAAATVLEENTVEAAEKPKEQKKAEKDAKAELTAQLETAKNDYLRLYADFDNYRKRTAEQGAKDRQNGIAFAIESLLPALDSIERALTVVKDDAANAGLVLVQKQFEKGLTALGVEEIAATEDFDANLHYAVMSEANPEKSGKILEVLQKGYRFKDKVIRHAMVKVAE